MSEDDKDIVKEIMMRSMGQIMFHAPYFSGKNEYGEKDIDCDVGEESLAELKDYYISNDRQRNW